MPARATTISTGLLLLLLLPAISAAGDFIRSNCDATSYPDVCYSSLSDHAKKVGESLAKLASVAIEVSYASARDVASYISNLSHKTNSDKATAAVLKDCTSNYGDAIDQMQRSSSEILHLDLNSKDLQFQIDNVQTWMTAALTNLDTCADEFGDLRNPSVKSDVNDRVVNGKKLASIALTMATKFAESIKPKA